MHISPKNPYFISLRNSLIEEGLGREKPTNLSERATILGMTVKEYEEFIKTLPFLREDEIFVVIQRIIAWYQAKELVAKIASK